MHDYAASVSHLDARMRALIASPLAAEFTRYFASGLIALCVDFSLYVALSELAGWHYLASAAAAFGAGLTTVYLFSVFWVFRQRRFEHRSHEFLLFAAIGIVGLALTTVVLYMLTDIVGLDYRISKIGSVGIVFIFNFGCRKFLLFRNTLPSL